MRTGLVRRRSRRRARWLSEAGARDVLVSAGWSTPSARVEPSSRQARPRCQALLKRSIRRGRSTRSTVCRTSRVCTPLSPQRSAHDRSGAESRAEEPRAVRARMDAGPDAHRRLNIRGAAWAQHAPPSGCADCRSWITSTKAAVAAAGDRAARLRIATSRRRMWRWARRRVAASYFQPRSHWPPSVKSRHWSTKARFECTASNSTCSTRTAGGSGSTTRITRKCFSLLRGLTAVHLVSNSFFGLSGVLFAVAFGAGPSALRSDSGVIGAMMPRAASPGVIPQRS